MDEPVDGWGNPVKRKSPSRVTNWGLFWFAIWFTIVFFVGFHLFIQAEWTWVGYQIQQEQNSPAAVDAQLSALQSRLAVCQASPINCR